MKQWMLRLASFRIRNNTSVENFAKNLDLEDIRDILNQRKRNGSSNRNMSKSKGWTLQSSLLMLWMEKTQVNNQTKIDDDVNILKTL